MATDLALPDDYADLIARLKGEIRTARVKAALAVNGELIELYWRIGRMLNEQVDAAAWGSKVLEQAARDLRQEFPEMKGLSRSNLMYMRQFAAEWPDEQIVPQLVGRLPWGHNRVLLSRLKDEASRRFYAEQAITNGWSRNVLEFKIDSRLLERTGRAPSNFEVALPPADSDLALSMLDDPHDLGYLDLVAGHSERHLEDGIVERVQEFMQQFGRGNLAFMGRQWHMEVGGDDFYLDRLFYHVKLHRYVVVEMKNGKLRVGDIAQTKFYAAAMQRELHKNRDCR